MFPDLKFAFRQLTRSPGFSAIAIVTLTLGIGLTTAMFSFVNTLLLRPLPYPEAERIVKLFRTTSESQYGNLSPADYLDLRRNESRFGLLAGYRSSERELAGLEQTAEWTEASASLFGVLGVQPALGRFYTAKEEILGNDHVVVISDGFWRRQLGKDRNVIGRTVQNAGQSYQIIGVLPPEATDYRLFGKVGLFSPLTFDQTSSFVRSSRSIQMLGRRNAALSGEQASAVVVTLGAQLAADHPIENAGSALRLEALQAQTTGPTGRAIVGMLLGLSFCVLLIACSNLANFHLARAIERSRELAVRSALGASRAQLLRPILFESLLLSMIGGACALLVAQWTTDWLEGVLARGIGFAPGFPVDWRVLTFALGASATTLVVVSVAPLLFTFRLNTNEKLKSGARGATTGPGQQRLRNGLIIAQFAFAMTLAAAAGFFERGIANLFRADHGWDAGHVVQAELKLPDNGYDSDAKVRAIQQNLVERLAQIPGVASAGFSHALPFLGFRELDHFVADTASVSNQTASVETMINGVSPDYFAVTRTRLVAGRTFRETDNASAPKVAIVSQSLARALFPDGNPIGHRMALSEQKNREWIEIVGVAADVSSADVARRPISAQLYQPAAQNLRRDGFIAVRLSGANPADVIGAIRTAVKAIDPAIHLRNLLTAERAMEEITSQMVICQQLLTAFALLGLLLAVVGIYGVITRLVVQRTGEIGIRMALGAQVVDVMRLILQSGVRIAAIGVSLGLFGAFALSFLLSKALPTMQTNRAAVVGLAGCALVLIALAACWFPARRAAHINPLDALRAE